MDRRKRHANPSAIHLPADFLLSSLRAGLSLRRWSELQDFTDQFRRLYPPFWWPNDPAPEPGLCRRSLHWLGENERPLTIAEQMHPGQLTNGSTGDEPIPHLLLDSPAEHFDAFTREGGQPPLFAHWQWLFGPSIDIVQKLEHIRPR